MNIINEYINISSIQSIIEEYDMNAVFCCFDSYNTDLLELLYNNFETDGIPVYISGYNGGKIIALKITRSFLSDNRRSALLFNDRINENAGVGFIGDLAAVFMVRLWLPEQIPSLNQNINRIDYNYLVPNHVEYKKYYNSSIETVIDRYLSAKHLDAKEHIKNSIIFPMFLDLYSDYCFKPDSEKFDRIVKIDNSFMLGFLDEADEKVSEYLTLLDNKKIHCDNRDYSMEEFAFKILRDEYIANDCIQQYINNQIELVDISIKSIKYKKEKYYEDLKTIWKEKRQLKEVLMIIAKKIIDVIYKDNIIDYNLYKPYYGMIFTLEEAIKLISKIDEFTNCTDISGFIEYCYKHNMLHVTEERVRPICIWNPRYGSVNIIATYNGSGKELLELTHEIGHGYYYSYLQKGFGEKYLDMLVSEVLAIMTEFKLISRILEEKTQNVSFLNTIVYRIQGALIGVFSLDIYEEYIFNLDEITMDNILSVRSSLIKEFFGDRIVKNDEYSKYNITISPEVLFDKRDTYLYPQALLLGYKLAMSLKENPLLEIQLLKILSEYSPDKITIEKIFETLFGITLSHEYYLNIGEELTGFTFGIMERIRENERK